MMYRLMGEEVKIPISDKEDGERLDRLLSIFVPNISRSHIQKIIKDGGVTVNGETCLSKKYVVRTGEVVEMKREEEAMEVKPEAADIPLNILYEDEDLLVVDKPKGMVVQPGVGHRKNTLVNALLHHCGNHLSSIGGPERPGIVHRIDKDTGGLLLVAKNDVTHRNLAKQLATHRILRGYQAIVHHGFRQEEGRIDLPVGRDPKNRTKRKVGTPDSRPAVTHYKVLERLGDYTLLELRLETGRPHQIRVHMAHMNHPLLGDLLYGPRKNSLGIKGQMLYADRLAFIHPGTGKHMEFQEPLPEEFTLTLKKLRVQLTK